MLKGLEATIIRYKEIHKDNEEFRIDSEYYKKEYLNLYKLISNSILLNDIVKMSDLSTNGSFKTVSNIIHDNKPKIIPFIRSGNAGETFIKESDLEFISKEAHLKLQKSKTNLYDIIMARKGKVGGASIIMEKQVNFNCNENVIKLNIKDKLKIIPHYFTVFFNSKYGYKQVERLSTGNVQPWVSIFQIRKLKFIILNLSFQEEIKKLVDLSYGNYLNSYQKYISAESLLLETIGLKNFKPSTDPINIKSFKKSFLTTGRLDSEYYQKKYEEIVNHIKAQKYDSLSNIVKIKKSIEPGSDVYSDEGIPFLRVADYNKFGINEPEKKLSYSFCKANKDLIKDLKPKKETILFSKDGTLGLAYMLRKDEEIITSGAILHLTVKDKSIIIPEYLTLALNSILVQMQAERDSGGSIILHWRINEIENVIVPIIDYAKQQQIAKLVEESFALKKQSEHLLDTAKRAVEIAIEQNEEGAIKYINNNK